MLQDQTFLSSSLSQWRNSVLVRGKWLFEFLFSEDGLSVCWCKWQGLTLCLSLVVQGECADNTGVCLPLSCGLGSVLLGSAHGIQHSWTKEVWPAENFGVVVSVAFLPFQWLFLQILELLSLLQPKLRTAPSPRQHTAAGTHFMNFSWLEIVSKLFL